MFRQTVCSVLVLVLLAILWGALLSTSTNPVGWPLAVGVSGAVIAFIWWQEGEIDDAQTKRMEAERKLTFWEQERGERMVEYAKQVEEVKQAQAGLAAQRVEMAAREARVKASETEARQIWARLTMTLEERRAKLSGSERHILELMEQGESDVDVSAELGVSRQSINVKRAIFRAMGFGV